MKHSQLIVKSEKLIIWLDQLVSTLSLETDDFRHRVAGGCLDVTAEHHKAIVMLVANKLYAPAFALMRLLLESYVRGVWLHKCADDRDLERYKKDKVPSYYELVESIENLKSHQDGTFSRMKERSWKAMNSYSHTGFLQASRRQTDNSIESNYDDEEIVEVMKFADAIGCLAAIAICDLSNNAKTANVILDKVITETQ